MKKKILTINIAIYAICLLYFLITISQKYGMFVYALDDAYIHLAMAKNFAQHGVWGVTAYEFSSSSSSPMYTLLLSELIYFFGNHTVISLIINVLFSFGVIFCAHRLLKNCSTILYGFALTAIIWLTPLFVMIMCGMEHTMHIFFMLLSILALRNYLNKSTTENFLYLSLIAFISVGIRYESLFLFLGICLVLFFVKKQFLRSVLFGVICLMPILIYGLISMQKGSFFFPNSLLVKANINNDFFHKIGMHFRGSHAVLPFVLLLVFGLFRSYKNLGLQNFLSKNSIQIVILLTFIFHFILADFGWLYRYEAYLIVLLAIGIAFSAEGFARISHPKALIVFAGLLMLIPLYSRTYRSFKNIEKAPQNIFQQQMQMAFFLHKYYDHSKVIANDIGAICYFSNVHILDAVGLASKEIIEAKKNNQNITNFIENYAEKNNDEIAIVYDTWVKMPKSATKVAQWKINDIYVSAFHTVSFYEMKNGNPQKLYENVKDYQKFLDKGVELKLITPSK